MSKTYSQVQAEAKKLGLPYNGVSRVELEASINQAKKNAPQPATPATDLASMEELQGAVPIADNTLEATTIDYDAAQIRDGNNQLLRTYTRADHGEDFAALAYQYATKRKFTVALVKSKPKLTCPNCGTTITP